jgi:S1-C subfamily serine protease
VAAAGSGVIIDTAKGLVVTNHHVVKTADRITVTIKDDRQLEAKLVGSDAATDIALLKVEPKNLSAVVLGDSDTLMVGDVVPDIATALDLPATRGALVSSAWSVILQPIVLVPRRAMPSWSSMAGLCPAHRNCAPGSVCGRAARK